MTDTATLWELETSLGTYTPDLADEFIITIGKDFTRMVSLDEYIRDLYEERSADHFERNLEYEAPAASRVLCVSGERGSGKTSAIEFVRRRLAKAHPEILFFRLDLKKLYDYFFSTLLTQAYAIHTTPGDAYELAFRLLIRTQLTDALFPNPIAYRSLVTWALAGEPDNTDNFPRHLMLDFADLHRDVAYRAQCESLPREQRKTHITELFMRDPDRYDAYRQAVEKLVRAPHLVHAYVSKHRSTQRVLLVLDNVDRIPTEHQPKFLLACRDLRMSMGTRCSITVAIRIENVKERRPSIPGEDQFFDLILPDGQKYSGLLLPRIEAEHMRAVLQKRDLFASKVLGEQTRPRGRLYRPSTRQRFPGFINM